MVRALLVSFWVSVTPMMGAVWVSNVSGVGVVGGGDVAGGVTVDGVGDADGGCCLWVWVCVRRVIGLLSAFFFFDAWRSPKTTQNCSTARFLEGQPLFTAKPYRIQT